MTKAVITLDGVHKKFFQKKDASVHAVNGVSLEIYEGEIFGVIGFSGAGKSTLVRLLNGLEPLTAGTMTVLGNDVSRFTERQWRPVRRDIAMVFQQFNLFNSKTVAENIAYPLKLDKWPNDKIDARVREVLAYVGLEEKINAYPDQLSGGQMQRVGIARALARRPKILLADEATSALDPETTRDVLALLKQVNEDLGITIIIITHAMDVVRYVCDRVAVMEHGHVIEMGDVYQVFAEPKHETTRRFVGTALRDRPSADVLAGLKKSYPGTFIHVEVADTEANDPSMILQTLNTNGVRGTIVYGGIQAVGHRPFGSLTFSLSGNDDAIATAIEQLREYTDVEVLQ